MKTAIVVTSIHDCTELLSGYLANFAKYGREASVYLIPDLKTPEAAIPMPVKVPTMYEQEQFLEKVGFPAEDVPRNSDNRRNVGYLMALADGAEMVVSLDDDNYCPENADFIGEHWKSFSKPLPFSVEGTWFNNLTLFNGVTDVYARGFPYYARNSHYFGSGIQTRVDPVRINAGMWIVDADLDAMTWLHTPLNVVHCQGEATLSSDTWCPINSQNTAVHRDLMPAYYFARMIPPHDRFGDIFQGYFALKVAKHMGWTARFGSPVVTHRRNSHVYLKDVQKEIEPILLLEEFLPKLIKHKLTGTTVHEAHLSLADFVESQGTDFYRGTARLMRQWAETCRRIG